MKTHLFLFVSITIAFLSCKEKLPRDNPPQDIPQALNDDKGSFRMSKDGYYHLVDDLYEELAAKSPELKLIDGKVEMLQASEDDSINAYVKYNEKNKSYYYNTQRYLQEIKDTVFRAKIESYVNASNAGYNNRIAKYDRLINEINTKKTKLNDLYIALKIMQTLPLIEKYQKEYLPDTKPLEGFSKEQDTTLQKVSNRLYK